MGASKPLCRVVTFCVLAPLGWTKSLPAAAEPSIEANLSCARRSDPGRVGCELGVRSRSQRYTLDWVDGLVVEVPGFLQPLRARITTQLPSEGKAAATVPLAFWASELGRGFVAIEVRAVLCEVGDSPKHCTPVLVRISKQITVG